MIKWSLVTRKIKDLKEHPRNPRNLTKDQANHLGISIDKFGVIDKPIINHDNLIIGGHQRLKILRKKGIKEIECWYPDPPLTMEQVDELNIRLNRNNGEWDYEKLANEWEIELLIDYGFNPEELGILTEPEEIPDYPNESETCEMCGQKIKAK